MKVRWEVGPRIPVGNNVTRGKGANAQIIFEPRSGKNQGPVFSQTVVKVIAP